MSPRTLAPLCSSLDSLCHCVAISAGTRAVHLRVARCSWYRSRIKPNIHLGPYNIPISPQLDLMRCFVREFLSRNNWVTSKLFQAIENATATISKQCYIPNTFTDSFREMSRKIWRTYFSSNDAIKNR